MKNIADIASLEVENADSPDAAMMTTLPLGRSAGSQKLYANIDRLQPGAKSCKLHCHSQQEEFFLVLRGSCTVIVGQESYCMKEGSFLAKPAGQGIAHQFINDSESVVEILDVGTIHPDDVIEYPDEGVRYIPSQGRAWKNGTELASFDTDPNTQTAEPLKQQQEPAIIQAKRLSILAVGDEHRLTIKQRTEEQFGGPQVVSKGVLHEPAKLPGFIAFQNEALAGLATFTLSGQTCQLITIDALARHKGTGTALLAAVEAKAREAGCTTVCVTTTNDNLDALRFYQRRGYRLAGINPGAIARSRELKPAIPQVGNFGIAICAELELQKFL